MVAIQPSPMLLLHFRVRIVQVLVTLCGLLTTASVAAEQAWQTAAANALRASDDGTALVLDVKDNRLLAVVHPHLAATLRTTPGSAIKPFVLYALLKSGRWSADRRLACHRTLTIAGRRMDCVHPQIAASFDARAALAYSCNRYFSQAALALSAESLQAGLRRSGLNAATGLLPAETTGKLRTPHSDEQQQMLALGVDGITVTPLELAESYRWLLLQMNEGDQQDAARTLRGGLADSVNFGMASAAAVTGIAIAGKTGTAGTYAGSETHGWFVGYAPVADPQVVVVVYIAHGRGSDAASQARTIFASSPLAHHK